MELDFKHRLIQNYNSFKEKNDNSTLKYSYSYNNVRVRLYFDTFDNESLSLTVVLIYGDQYYYSPLKIGSGGVITSYLPKLSGPILSRLLYDGQLKKFYSNMNNHILSDEFELSSYESDKDFLKGISYENKQKKKTSNPPFWYCLRRKRMSDKTLKVLKETMDIEAEKLLRIQAANMTLVRTADIRKRKTLTAILGDNVDVI